METGGVAPRLSSGLVELGQSGKLLVDKFDKVVVAGAVFVTGDSGLKPVSLNMHVCVGRPSKFVAEVTFQLGN